MLCAQAKGSEGGMNAGTIVHLVHMVLQKVLLTTMGMGFPAVIPHQASEPTPNVRGTYA